MNNCSIKSSIHGCQKEPTQQQQPVSIYEGWAKLIYDGRSTF